MIRNGLRTRRELEFRMDISTSAALHILRRLEEFGAIERAGRDHKFRTLRYRAIDGWSIDSIPKPDDGPGLDEWLALEREWPHPVVLRIDGQKRSIHRD